MSRQRPSAGARPRNPNLAAFLSFLVPGAGQLYNREWVKGGVILALVLGALGYYVSVVLSALADGATPEAIPELLGGTAWMMGVITLVQIGATVDAYLKGRRERLRAGAKVEAPAPGPRRPR